MPPSAFLTEVVSIHGKLYVFLSQYHTRNNKKKQGVFECQIHSCSYGIESHAQFLGFHNFGLFF